jgi:alkaline phosphatase D
MNNNRNNRRDERPATDNEFGASPHDSGRRRLVLGAAGFALAMGSGVGLAGCGGGGDQRDERFGYGVASGDPLSDRVILWTRLNLPEPAPATVQWEVATEPAFSNVVRSGTAATSDAQDFTVKVDATGLQPATIYYYRFRHGGEVSVTGRTKTLPTGNAGQVRMAVFSCAAYPLGQFHVYADAARRGDIDVALHLGDYIYETGISQAEQAAATLLGRKLEPRGELVTLSDYRRRYAHYHTDSDLRAMHATMPVIAVWDDHEFVNDIWRDGAGAHDPASEGSFAARRAAAAQAWHEWLPVRMPDPSNPLKIYRSFDFGNLMTLHMLDTRVIGRDAPIGRDAYLAGAAADPARELLGTEQMAWLADGMRASQATWQVVGQQVLMGRLRIPLSIYDNFKEDSINEYLRAIDTPEASRDDRQRALVNQPFIPFELGNWNSFEAAREKVLAAARSMDKNLVVLSGDSHNAWADNLTDASGQSVGVEFGVPSVTSTGLEIAHTDVTRQFLADSFVRMMPDLKYAETSHRGYLVVTVTPQATQTDFVFVSSVLQNSFDSNVPRTLRTLPGSGNRTLAAA